MPEAALFCDSDAIIPALVRFPGAWRSQGWPGKQPSAQNSTQASHEDGRNAAAASHGVQAQLEPGANTRHGTQGLF